VRCWGWDYFGQIGNPTDLDSLTPQRVERVSRVVQLSAAQLFTCVRLDDATVWCWGYGGDGALGDGDYASTSASRAVPGLSNVEAIFVGGTAYHACVALTGGAVMCWGQNTYGQLGDGTTTNRATPVKALGL
jgi:alpha-tubulin suppressor-like RCC1 family protein